MAVKYRAEFRNIRGQLYKVEILQNGYVGSVNTFELYGSDGVKIDYQKKGDRTYNLIKSSSATLDFIVENDTDLALIESIATAEDGDYTLKVSIDDTWGGGNEPTGAYYRTFWCGFLQTDLIQFKDDAYPLSLKITAIDALGYMKDKKFQLADATPIDERFSIVNLICKLFELTGITDLWDADDLFLQTFVIWYENNTMTAGTDDPAKKSGIFTSIFNEYNDGEFQPKSMMQVMLAICNLFQARIIQADGKYVFHQVRKLNETSQKRYQYKKDGDSHATSFVNNSIFAVAGEYGTTLDNNPASVAGFYERTHSYTRPLNEVKIGWKALSTQVDGSIYPLAYNNFVPAPSLGLNLFEDEATIITTSEDYAEELGPYIFPTLSNWQNIGFTSEPPIGGEIDASASTFNYRIRCKIRWTAIKNNNPSGSASLTRFLRLPFKIWLDTGGVNDRYLKINNNTIQGNFTNTDISEMNVYEDDMPCGSVILEPEWSTDSNARVKLSSSYFGIDGSQPVNAFESQELQFLLDTPNIPFDGTLKIVCDELEDIKAVNNENSEVALDHPSMVKFNISAYLLDFRIFILDDGAEINNTTVQSIAVDGNDQVNSSTYEIANTYFGDGPSAAGDKVIWINTTGSTWVQALDWNFNDDGSSKSIQQLISEQIFTLNRDAQEQLAALCVEPYVNTSQKYNEVGKIYNRSFINRDGSASLNQSMLFQGGSYNLGNAELNGQWQRIIEALPATIQSQTIPETIQIEDPTVKPRGLNPNEYVADLANQVQITYLTDEDGIDDTTTTVTSINVNALDYDYPVNTEFTLIDPTGRISQTFKLKFAAIKGGTLLKPFGFTPLYTFPNKSRIVASSKWLTSMAIENQNLTENVIIGVGFYDNLNTTRHYLPFYSTNETTANTVDDVNLVATHDGRFNNIVLRTDSGIAGSGTITITAYKVRTLSTTLQLVEQVVLSVTSADNRKALAFVFSNTSTYQKGERLLIAIQCGAGVSTASRYWYGSLMLTNTTGTEYDTSGKYT